MPYCEGRVPLQLRLLALSGYSFYIDPRSLDGFLREIRLECCGHMSAFFAGDYEEIAMSIKISTISDRSILRYEYDFGSTTELKISFVWTITREYQKNAVRLLVRNKAQTYTCSVCGKPATQLCCNCFPTRRSSDLLQVMRGSALWWNWTLYTSCCKFSENGSMRLCRQFRRLRIWFGKALW